MICDQCETVAHCMKHGCVPKQPMPTKDEALKLALEALQEPLGFTGSREIDAKLRLAITAIKQALAAPVQEPFAWCIDSEDSADWCFAKTEDGVKSNSVFMDEYCIKTNPFPLYTTPPAAQQRIDELEAELMRMQGRELKFVMALNSADPLAQPSQQEPAAWMDRDGDLYANEPDKNWCPPHYPLYTTPPAAQPAVLEGWKLVPVELTPEMEDAAMAYVYINGFTRGDGPHRVYRAMLAAAPVCDLVQVGKFVEPRCEPLTDEQMEAAIKAWFETDVFAGRQSFAKRMRAAFAAAHGIKENT